MIKNHHDRHRQETTCVPASWLVSLSCSVSHARVVIRYYANYLKFMERARSRLVGMRRVAGNQDPQVAAVAVGLRVSERAQSFSLTGVCDGTPHRANAFLLVAHVLPWKQLN